MKQLFLLILLIAGLGFFLEPKETWAACGTMQANSGIRGCTPKELPAVSQPSAAACSDYCASKNATACEWLINGNCYVEYGSGCYVQEGFNNWSATVCADRLIYPDSIEISDYDPQTAPQYGDCNDGDCHAYNAMPVLEGDKLRGTTYKYWRDSWWYSQGHLTNGLGSTDIHWAGQTFKPSAGVMNYFNSPTARYRIKGVIFDNVKIGTENSNVGGDVRVSVFRYSGNSAAPAGAALENVDTHLNANQGLVVNFSHKDTFGSNDIAYLQLLQRNISGDGQGMVYVQGVHNHFSDNMEPNGNSSHIDNGDAYPYGNAYFRSLNPQFGPWNPVPSVDYNGSIQDADLAQMRIWADRLDASCASISPPGGTSGTVESGKSYTASVQMRNTGTTTWTAGNNYNLGSQDSQDNTNWGFGRVATTGSVIPGGTAIYNFTVTAPTVSSPTTYNFNWQMVQDGAAWFGNKCTSTVTVNPAAAAAFMFGQIRPDPATCTAGCSSTITWNTVNVQDAYVEVNGANFSNLDSGTKTDNYTNAGSYVYTLFGRSAANNPYQILKSATVTVNAAAPPPPASSPTNTPWLKTVGGDVHTNR